MREKLGIEKNEYKRFYDFKIKCIEMAVKEINANNDIRIFQIDYPTTGRNVSHIVFHCEKSKQIQLNISEPTPTIIEVKKEHPDDVRELITM